MKRLLLLSCLVAWGLLLLAGCTSPPFAPIAVPNSSAIHEKHDGPAPDPEKIKSELAELQKVTYGDYLLKPGDSFAIIIDGQNEKSRPVVKVMPNGAISVAPIGYMQVAGLTIPAVTKLLSSKYKRFFRNCEIIIEPQVFKPDAFSISGSVKNPGVYPFVFGSFRLIDAVATAGGLATVTSGTRGDRYELADLANAYIVRNGRVLPVDFIEAIAKGNPLHNIPLMNGDAIHIPSLDNGKITVLGEVGSPDCIPFQPGLTLLQAIGYAGGLKETNSWDVKVIRGGLKNPVVFTMDIVDIQKGRRMDFALKPRDIVFVPRSGISEWNVIVRQILPSIQLLNGLAGPFGSPSNFLYR